MPTPTISRPSSTRRQQQPQHGRFSRGPSPARKPPARGRRAAPTQSRFSMPARRQQKQSTMSKMMSSVQRAMPGMGSQGKKRSTSGKASTGKRAGSMALLAGGVGLAMKNRDRLMGMFRHDEHAATPSQPHYPQPPHPAP